MDEGMTRLENAHLLSEVWTQAFEHHGTKHNHLSYYESPIEMNDDWVTVEAFFSLNLNPKA